MTCSIPITTLFYLPIQHTLPIKPPFDLYNHLLAPQTLGSNVYESIPSVNVPIIQVFLTGNNGGHTLIGPSLNMVGQRFSLKLHDSYIFFQNPHSKHSPLSSPLQNPRL